ncbi:uncharacterized protein METZ01_LOCUS106785 [marine metagenome]|uniref:peptidylprolyl isomerase n=1 Tax=marine metagenome TaxID=408172 RepID=A0A381WNR8_9ZZZZ
MGSRLLSHGRLCGLAIAAWLLIGGMGCGGGEETQKKPPVGTPQRMIINTTKGKIVCELYPDKTPITVNTISELAEGSREWIHPATGQKMINAPFYDGVIFHRVIPDFMIQAGDPLGKGYGGPGFEFQDEFSEDLTFDKVGLLAMANPGRPNTNGSQFFITVTDDLRDLNFKHTIFGQVSEGQDVAVAISKVARDGGDMPRQDVIINSITIERE